MSQTDFNAKELWKEVSDADGWISIRPSDALDKLGIEAMNLRNEAGQALIQCHNSEEIEWENDKQDRWRFKE